MPPIRRAAVSGLFALWLSPLPPLGGSQSSAAPGNGAEARRPGVESPQFAHGREPRDGWRDDARPYLPWGYAPRRDGRDAGEA